MRATITTAYSDLFSSLGVKDTRTTWIELFEKIADEKDLECGIKVGIKGTELSIYDNTGTVILKKESDRQSFLDDRGDIDLNNIYYTLCEMIKDNLWKKPRKKRSDAGIPRKK